MATLTNAARAAMVQALCELIDANGGGSMVFETSGDAEVATLGLEAQAFATYTNGVATADTITSDTSAAGGTIEHASFYDGASTKVIELTCGVGSGEIQFPGTLVIGAGDTVACSSLTLTMPAS